MLLKGQGCDADKARAISWLREAAAQNVAEAEAALGAINELASAAPQNRFAQAN